jgi:hypothetical protein
MVQAREGWHLEHEPFEKSADPTEHQKRLLAYRADLHAAYTTARADGLDEDCEEIREAVAELDQEIRAAGVRGRLAPLDPLPKAVRRTTRRRQDAPDLPRRPVENRTVGEVFGGKYRPSTFLTLTLDSYGRVDADGAALDPDSYDYSRAARDAIHFPRLVDRFWQNTRRCVGWEVQYFGTVEPQKRGAPHFHAAIRGTIPRSELRAIAAATYHQVFWPAHDEITHDGDRLPRWADGDKGFVDPHTREPLPTFDEATDPDVLTEPTHVVTFGTQVHVKGILGGTEEAGRHVGYLTKYLTKSIGQAAGLTENATARQREHHRRLTAELAVTPCSPRCGIWLLYGIQPRGARLSTKPGQCRSKAHKPEHLGIAGRRTTAPSERSSFGNCSTAPGSSRRIRSTTGRSLGNAPHPATPTSHRGRSCSCTRSTRDSDGAPTTTPHSSPQAHPWTTVRQPRARRHDQGDRTTHARRAVHRTADLPLHLLRVAGQGPGSALHQAPER